MIIHMCRPCVEYIRESADDPAFMLTLRDVAPQFQLTPAQAMIRITRMHHSLGHPDAVRREEIFAQWDREESSIWN